MLWVRLMTYEIMPSGRYLSQASMGFRCDRAWGLIYRGWSMSALGEPEEGYARGCEGSFNAPRHWIRIMHGFCTHVACQRPAAGLAGRLRAWVI